MSSSYPLVSVVLPAYNAKKFIKKSVLSILDQTYSNIELIVINDGSTDETLKILKYLQKTDSRLIIINRENRGLVNSLNEGIAIARGAWVARMDADDISMPNRIERQLFYANSHHLDLCGSYIKTFGICRQAVRKYPIEPAAANLQLAFNTCFAHPTLFARAKVLKDNPYIHQYEKIEDYELWTRLAAIGYRLGNIPEVLLKYRRTFTQSTSVHRRHQDAMRINIAKKYVGSVLPILSEDLIEILLSRSAYFDSATVYRCVQEIHGRILSGKDIENVLSNNMNLFLAHNCCHVDIITWNRLKRILPLRYQLTLSLLRFAGIGPGHRLWNLFYLLK